MWEAVLFNLGRVFLKIGDYAGAINYLQQSLVLAPGTASAHAALAYAYHCMGDADRAVLGYHNALAHNADDVFSSSMLQHVMLEMVDTYDHDGDFDSSGIFLLISYLCIIYKYIYLHFETYHFFFVIVDSSYLL